MASETSGLLEAEPISIITAENNSFDECEFSPISLFEKDSVPSRMRSDAFNATWQGAYGRLTSLVRTLYEPCIANVCERMPVKTSPLLPVTILDASGSATYEAFPTLLMHHLSSMDHVTVQLSPFHCINLSTMISAFVSQILHHIPCTPEISGLCQAYEPNDLTLVMTAYRAAGLHLPRIVILLHEIQTFPSSVMNDFLSAVMSWSDITSPTPSIHLLITYTAPLPLLPRSKVSHDLYETTTWVTSLFAEQVRMYLDPTTIVLPDKSEFWESVGCAFFAEPRSGLWLGRSIFELVRRRYWHTTASWDAMAQCIRLAYLEHFRTRPLSAFVQGIPDVETLSAHWTSEIYAELRLSFFLRAAIPSGVSPHMRELAYDNSALLHALSGLQSDMAVSMSSRATALAALHEVLCVLGLTGAYGTKLGLTGCTAIALEWIPPFTDWDASRTTANALTATTPTAQQVDALLSHLCSTLENKQVSELVDGISRRLHAIESNLDAAVAAAVRSTHESLLSVQHAAHTKARAQNSMGEALASWVSGIWRKSVELPPSLGLSIWTYDFGEPISTMLEGAARSTIILALDAPSDTLASMSAAACTAPGQRELSDQAPWYEWEEHISEVHALRETGTDLVNASVPDVCRLFSLYKDSSRFINLADWYEAFVQSLQGEEVRRKHAGLDMENEDTVASTQMRFSLALNELAYMGIVGPAGRKIEHVSRLIWDLPVNGMHEA